jgi:hypothetical protein
MRTKKLAILLTALVAILPLSATAGPGNPNDPNVSTSTYIILQLTNNDVDDSFPVISGNNIAWRQSAANNVNSIMLRNTSEFGNFVQTLATGSTINSRQNLWGTQVVWSEAGDVWIGDGTSPATAITNTANQDEYLQKIWNQHVAFTSNESGLQVWDGQNILTVPNGDPLDEHSISGTLAAQPNNNTSHVLYRNKAEAGESKIWAYDVYNQQQTLLNDPAFDWSIEDIHIEDTQAVWAASYSDNGPQYADSEIYAYDLAQGASSYQQVTQNDIYDAGPLTNGEDIVWLQAVVKSGPVSLMHYQNGTTSTLADSSEIRGYVLSDPTVAWTQGSDSSAADYDFIVRTGNVDYNFTAHAGAARIEISEKNLVWEEYDDNDTEIWAAFFVGPYAQVAGMNFGLFDFSGFQMMNANLQFTDLRSALIEGTDFRGADFTGATSLEYAIGQAIYSHLTILPEGFDAQAAGWNYVTPEPSAVLLALLGLALLPRRGRKQRR